VDSTAKILEKRRTGSQDWRRFGQLEGAGR